MMLNYEHLMIMHVKEDDSENHDRLKRDVSPNFKSTKIYDF